MSGASVRYVFLSNAEIGAILKLIELHGHTLSRENERARVRRVYERLAIANHEADRKVG